MNIDPCGHPLRIHRDQCVKFQFNHDATRKQPCLRLDYIIWKGCPGSAFYSIDLNQPPRIVPDESYSPSDYQKYHSDLQHYWRYLLRFEVPQEVVIPRKWACKFFFNGHPNHIQDHISKDNRDHKSQKV
ncbi:hypothetical protein ACOME3_003174 [Neoechinorhynchus agilis]